MKRTAKLLTLAVALFAGFGTSTAQAADGSFKIGADVVSSYVWRGSEYGNSPAIQPAITYTASNGISLGAWGSYAIEKATDGANGSFRYQEVDLTLSVPVGPLTLSVVDYYIPDMSTATPDLRTRTTRAFDFSKDSSNTLEAQVAYSIGDLSLLAGYNFAGFDPLDKHAFYGEGSYKFFSSKDGFSAKAIAGVGSKYYYGGVPSEETKLALVNTGISVSKDRFTASYVYNPISEKSSVVFMASF
ncbi:MAG: hypothetical protein HGB22_07225 [Chlorobiaceae bacterium]|nr:hypothetical protein [Chlorobiaceae bacterium]